MTLKNIMFYIVVIITFLLDFLSKDFFQNFLYKKISLISDLLFLEIIYNTGVAFSIQITGIFLKLLTVVIIVSIYLYYLLHDKKDNLICDKLGYGFVIGGALGNGYERIFIGQVTDFIGVKYFAIFNLADVFIFIGIFILIIGNYAKGCTKS